jgi:hypothetical protein
VQNAKQAVRAIVRQLPVSGARTAEIEIGALEALESLTSNVPIAAIAHNVWMQHGGMVIRTYTRRAD